MSEAKAVLEKFSLDHRLKKMKGAGRDPASPTALRHFGVTPDISEFIPIFRKIRPGPEKPGARLSVAVTSQNAKSPTAHWPSELDDKSRSIVVLQLE